MPESGAAGLAEPGWLLPGGETIYPDAGGGDPGGGGPAVVYGDSGVPAFMRAGALMPGEGITITGGGGLPTPAGPVSLVLDAHATVPAFDAHETLAALGAHIRLAAVDAHLRLAALNTHALGMALDDRPARNLLLDP